MPEIRQLPPSVVNKIAAGEVIERPASVVKEMLENAVDAGAKRIDIAIEAGGSELIRIADDGCGIAADQLTLAVASHATSKIRDADDLFSVRSLGFRGEALASIAEISQFTLRSRTDAAAAGAELIVHGGAIGQVAPCGCPVGTTIEVRNLFFNTPVRRKFLRTPQTELGHAVEAMTRLALAFPDVHFTMTHNGRLLHDLPPITDMRERVGRLFGEEVAASLIPVDGGEGETRLSGLFADPSQNRGSNRMQYLLLNGRHIRDRGLQHALGEAYRGLLMTGRFPVAFVWLTIPPEMVDVNVHPTKLEVRFQDGSRLYSLLLGSLRKKFLACDLTARVGADRQPPEPRSANGASSADAPENARTDHSHRPGVSSIDGSPESDARSPDAAQRRELVEWARGEIGDEREGTASGNPAGPPDASRESAFRLTAPSAQQQGRIPLQFEPSGRQVPPFKPFDDGRPRMMTPPLGQPPSPAANSPMHFVPPFEDDRPANELNRPYATTASSDESSCEPPLSSTNDISPSSCQGGIQLHNRYLITETEDGILIVDQHALHERVLYEQLRAKILNGGVEKQRLLVPEPVTLLPSEAAAVLDVREALAQMGVEIEPFGGDTILVTAYPALLANIGPAEMLRQIVEQLQADGSSRTVRDLIDEILHMMSCKAAVKAGDRLSPEEVAALLEQRHLFQDTHHCPHGRPTALLFTREELDKRFKRI